jgi:hypothetical protein
VRFLNQAGRAALIENCCITKKTSVLLKVADARQPVSLGRRGPPPESSSGERDSFIPVGQVNVDPCCPPRARSGPWCAKRSSKVEDTRWIAVGKYCGDDDGRGVWILSDLPCDTVVL